MKQYEVGKVWFQFFGNGVRKDTIIKIGKYNVELAGFGIISKKRLQNQWNTLIN